MPRTARALLEEDLLDVVVSDSSPALVRLMVLPQEQVSWARSHRKWLKPLEPVPGIPIVPVSGRSTPGIASARREVETEREGQEMERDPMDVGQEGGGGGTQEVGQEREGQEGGTQGAGLGGGA